MLSNGISISVASAMTYSENVPKTKAAANRETLLPCLLYAFIDCVTILLEDAIHTSSVSDQICTWLTFVTVDRNCS